MATVTLLVLDGFGVSKEKKGNAVLMARTPNYQEILAHFPNSLVEASGTCVGLPEGLMGNSEVGHLNIGAGRVVVQKLTQISRTIADGSFYQNPVLLKACQNASTNGKALHFFGLLSDGCVHSSLDHLFALLEMASLNGVKEVVVHPILDGRDTPPRSAKRFVKELEQKLSSYTKVNMRIGVVAGRYFAMDRDNRWERTEKYYQALVSGQAAQCESALAVVESAYAENTSDEFVLPGVVYPRSVQDGDSVICFNFRPDRVRQISRALTSLDFDGFERKKVVPLYYACLTEYDASLDLPVAFSPQALPSQDMVMTLPELLSKLSLKQFHTAETEKYAHVTYFFNGGKEAPYPGEDRLLVPSLKVATYDLAPQMQTPAVCSKATEAMRSGKYDFIILNFANPDMVGHTGILEAAIEAVESVDLALGHLLEAARSTKGTFLITADHGNCEQMIDPQTGEPHTAHTTNPVPAVVADFQGVVKAGASLKAGALCDIAPTICQIMSIDKPREMTGKSLLVQ